MLKRNIQEPVQRQIAYAQLAWNHPILKENQNTRCQYFNLLTIFCKELFRISQYGEAVLAYYKSVFDIIDQVDWKTALSIKLRVILLFDIIHISGYNCKVIETGLIKKFGFDHNLLLILKGLFSNFCYANKMWEKLFEYHDISSEVKWLECIRGNVAFAHGEPYRILVTATMSAGKSTFINALTGKKIAKTENLACTGRLHYIYNKPIDDKLVSKWDRSIVFDAKNSDGIEEQTQKTTSYEGVYYHSRLGGRQCMILDTPGVNSAEYPEHGHCTCEAIADLSYDVLIFLLNYEHIGTDDERAHLSFIKQKVYGQVPLIFCVNKIDSKKGDDLSLEEKMQDIRQYLQKQGFLDAPIFFVSARAAYLYRAKEELDHEDDLDDLEFLMRKLKRSVNVVELYRLTKPTYIQDRMDHFEFQCGIGYIEDYIMTLMTKKERKR